MSDFGVWESIETSDSEKKIASRKSEDKLAAAIYDVKDKYGEFLYASTALDEFHDRVALVKTDMMKTVDAHLMPVTGVMRRVIKACKDEWRYRTAAPSTALLDDPAWVQSVADAIKGGGFSFYQKPGDGPTSGYSVSTHPDREEIIDMDEVGPEDVSKFMDNNVDLYTGHPENMVGGWANQDNHKFYLDVPEHDPNLWGAVNTALDNDELAIFDLGHYWELPTEDDGQYNPLLDSHFARKRSNTNFGYGRRQADNTGPAMDLEETFTPSDGPLVPEGNFDGYLAEVEQGAPEKAGENFIEGRVANRPDGHSYMNQDGTCPDCFWGSAEAAKSNPEGFAEYKRGDGKMSYQERLKHFHPNGSEVGNIGRELGKNIFGSVDFAVYKDYCETNGLRVASIDSLDYYAENLSDAQYFRLASIIERLGAQPLPGSPDGGASGTVNTPTPSTSSSPAAGWGGALGQGGIANPDLGVGAGAFDQNMIAPGQLVARRRQAAGAGKTNYLQKADEALTQVLESKAEEFQETIAPLQQALQVIQQAEQAEQAANPMGVQPPPGTVNVLPGQDPSMGGGDPSMGGGDPSMGGDPMAGGGADLAQALGLAGAQGVPTPGPEGAQQQITGRKVAKDYGRKCPECKSVNTDYCSSTNDYDCYDCGVTFKPYSNSKKPKKEKESSRRQARADDIVGYTYDTQNFEPGDLIEYMIAKGELSPGARGMNIEDVLNQHAGGLGIDRQDERSYDSSEHPKVIFESQLDPEYDSDWYSGFREGSRRGGGAYPFVREGGIYQQYNSWLKKRPDLPRGGEADYWAFARENGFGENEVNSLINHFKPKSASRVSLDDGEVDSYPRTSGVRGQRSGPGAISGSNRSSSQRGFDSAGESSQAGGREERLSRRDGGKAGDGSLSGDSSLPWSQAGRSRGATPQRSASRQSSGESGVRDQGREHAGHGRARHAMVSAEDSLSSGSSSGTAESGCYPTEARVAAMQGLSQRSQVGEEASWREPSGRDESVLSADHGSRLKVGWTGWGFSPKSQNHNVEGWLWDQHLNGYVANKPHKFACSCGDEFSVPSYHNCKCGKIYNSYVIGTGGDNHTASIEKYICREIQVRPDVIVANRQAKRHKLTDPGALDDGEEDDLPTMKPVPGDWRRRNEHGQFSAKRR